MGAKETAVSKDAQCELGRHGGRVFRNNRGLFYTLSGEKTKAGLETAGASDLIGLTPMVITQEMVGKTVAVFTAIECKEPGWSRPASKTEQDQLGFINFVRKFGGIAFFLSDAKKIKEHLDAYKISIYNS